MLWLSSKFCIWRMAVDHIRSNGQGQAEVVLFQLTNLPPLQFNKDVRFLHQEQCHHVILRTCLLRSAWQLCV